MKRLCLFVEMARGWLILKRIEGFGFGGAHSDARHFLFSLSLYLILIWCREFLPQLSIRLGRREKSLERFLLNRVMIF